MDGLSIFQLSILECGFSETIDVINNKFRRKIVQCVAVIQHCIPHYSTWTLYGRQWICLFKTKFALPLLWVSSIDLLTKTFPHCGLPKSCIMHPTSPGCEWSPLSHTFTCAIALNTTGPGIECAKFRSRNSGPLVKTFVVCMSPWPFAMCIFSHFPRNSPFVRPITDMAASGWTNQVSTLY